MQRFVSDGQRDGMAEGSSAATGSPPGLRAENEKDTQQQEEEESHGDTVTDGLCFHCMEDNPDNHGTMRCPNVNGNPTTALYPVYPIYTPIDGQVRVLRGDSHTPIPTVVKLMKFLAWCLGDVIKELYSQFPERAGFAVSPGAELSCTKGLTALLQMGFLVCNGSVTDLTKKKTKVWEATDLSHLGIMAGDLITLKLPADFVYPPRKEGVQLGGHASGGGSAISPSSKKAPSVYLPLSWTSTGDTGGDYCSPQPASLRRRRRKVPPLCPMFTVAFYLPIKKEEEFCVEEGSQQEVKKKREGDILIRTFTQVPEHQAATLHDLYAFVVLSLPGVTSALLDRYGGSDRSDCGTAVVAKYCTFTCNGVSLLDSVEENTPLSFFNVMPEEKCLINVAFQEDFPSWASMPTPTPEERDAIPPGLLSLCPAPCSPPPLPQSIGGGGGGGISDASIRPLGAAPPLSPPPGVAQVGTTSPSMTNAHVVTASASSIKVKGKQKDTSVQREPLLQKDPQQQHWPEIIEKKRKTTTETVRGEVQQMIEHPPKTNSSSSFYSTPMMEAYLSTPSSTNFCLLEKELIEQLPTADVVPASRVCGAMVRGGASSTSDITKTSTSSSSTSYSTVTAAWTTSRVTTSLCLLVALLLERRDPLRAYGQGLRMLAVVREYSASILCSNDAMTRITMARVLNAALFAGVLLQSSSAHPDLAVDYFRELSVDLSAPIMKASVVLRQPQHLKVERVVTVLHNSDNETEIVKDDEVLRGVAHPTRGQLKRDSLGVLLGYVSGAVQPLPIYAPL